MSMNVGSSGGDDQSMMDINMTPLIDVLLVLLIFLIMSLPPSTHAIKLDMPRPTPPNNQIKVEPVVIELDIDFDGTYYWNGTQVPDLATLDSYFRQAAAQQPQPELHVTPNPRARYDYVAKALASAQRNQLLRMGFKGNEAYVED